jgi:hypothetical protein
MRALCFAPLCGSLSAVPAFADDPSHQIELQRRVDPDAALMAHDAAVAAGQIVSDGPSADVIKNLAPAGRGERLAPGATTDVWGIYKVPNQPWVYASDRNGGLYVLKEYGAGSAKQGKGGDAQLANIAASNK